jgi:hypothetical protein
MTATTTIAFKISNPSLKDTAVTIIPSIDKNARRVSQETLCTEEGSTHHFFEDISSEDGSSTSICPSGSISEVEEENHVDVITQDTNAEEPPKRSSIRFSTVEIRSYPMILGDNPSVTAGIPITIDWLHQDEVTCDVVDYEVTRPERRARLQLLLPPAMRAQIAMDAGSSRKELHAMQRKDKVPNEENRCRDWRKLWKLHGAPCLAKARKRRNFCKTQWQQLQPLLTDMSVLLHILLLNLLRFLLIAIWNIIFS